MKLKTSLLISIFCGIIAGCGLTRPSLTPQTQATISQVTQKSAVALSQAKAKAALAKAAGLDNPIMHPIAATNNLVVEIRPWLIAVTLLSGLLWAVEFGLSFTSFSFLSFLAPVFRWVFILSGAALLALPFLPLGFVLVATAAILLLIYELVKDKGDVAEAVGDEEKILGIKTAPAPTTLTITGAKP